MVVKREAEKNKRKNKKINNKRKKKNKKKESKKSSAMELCGLMSFECGVTNRASASESCQKHLRKEKEID